MTKQHVYLTLPSDSYRDIIIRADYKDMDKVNKLLDLLTKVEFTLVSTDTYTESQRFDVRKFEVIPAHRVVWENQLQYGVQSHFSYNYNDWEAAGCPKRMDEIVTQEEGESCAN
jgi:predicted AlkP superfamily phosphohydrolase/phosphomutase